VLVDLTDTGRCHVVLETDRVRVLEAGEAEGFWSKWWRDGGK